MEELAATSLQTLEANYPDHETLEDGTFTPRETEADTRGWLSQATLGLIESEAPRPDTSRANRDVIRQYEAAAQDLPE